MHRQFLSLVGGPALILTCFVAAVLVGGCGNETGGTGSSASTAVAPRSDGQTKTSNTPKATRATGEARPDSSTDAVSVASLDVCAALSVDELKNLLPIPRTGYEGEPLRLHASPLAEHPVASVTQYGCSYEDQFEQVWLTDGYMKSSESVDALVEEELRTEGEREWLPVTVDGYEGYYTPGISGLGFSTTELMLQIDDDIYFNVRPYGTSANPRGSPQEAQSAPWVQDASEKIAEAII